MNVVRASTAVLIFVCMMNAGAQSIYKWVDENGVTHFSERRPQDIEYERTNIRVDSGSRRSSSTSRDAPAATAAEPTDAEKMAAAATRRQEQREQTAQEKSQAEQERQTRTENCAAARQRLQKYATSRRLYYELDDGERQYLDDAELDEARAEARQNVSEWCG